MAIEAKITLNNEEFKKGLKDSERQAASSMKRIGGSSSGAGSVMASIANASKNAADIAAKGFSGVTGALSKMGPYGAAAAAAVTLIGGAATGVLKGVNALASHLDGVAKSAKSVNMSASAYLSLQHASNRAGIEMERILGVISKIDYAMNHAESGEKRYRDAFYSIGLSWRDLEQLSPEKRLMAINDALSRLKANGQKMPTEMFSVFEKEDMRTLNKMTSEKDFNKFIAEAEALGYTVPQSMVQAAESYQDSMGDAKDKMKAMIASMESVETITKGLTRLWESISSSIGKSNGYLTQYTDAFTGIANVTEELMTKNSGLLTQSSKMDILKKIYAYHDLGKNAFDEHGGDFYRYSDYLGGLDPKGLEREFKRKMGEIDFRNLSEGLQQMLFSYTEKVYKNFKARDKSTWVQRKEASPTEQLKGKREVEASRVEDEAELLNKRLQETLDYYDKANEKKGKLINADREILKLEEKLKKALNDQSASLDANLKHQIRMNAALANTKALQNEISGMKDRSEKSFSAFYADMLGQMGANKQMVDMYFASANSVRGGNGTRGDFISSLNYQLVRQQNPQQASESDDDYARRVHALMARRRKAGSVFKSPEEFLAADPDAFFRAFQGIAEDFSDSRIFRPLPDKTKRRINESKRTYAEYAERHGLKKKSLDIDADSIDTGEQARAYDEEVIRGIEAVSESQKREEEELDETEAKYLDIRQRLAKLRKLRESLTEDLMKSSGGRVKPAVKELAESLALLSDWEYDGDFVRRFDEHVAKTGNATFSSAADMYSSLRTGLIDAITKIAGSGAEPWNIVKEILAVNTKIGDLTFNEETEKVFRKFESSVRGLVKKRDELQKELDGINGEEPGGAGKRKFYEGQIKALDDRIKAYQDEKTKVEEALADLQTAFSRSKIAHEFKRHNEDAKIQQEVTVKWKLRQEGADLENEAGALTAEVSGDERKVDLLKQQAILKKAGVTPTKENLKLYRKELDMLTEMNRRLEAAKNFKALSGKADSMGAENRSTKAALNEDYAAQAAIERENVLRSIGVSVTEKNLEIYSEWISRIIAAQQEQKKLNLATKMMASAKDVRSSLMEKAGQGAEADSMKAREEARSQLGRELTPDETRRIDELAKLMRDASDFTLPQQKDDVVYSNELARRGGFSSSVVIDKSDTPRLQLRAQQEIGKTLLESNTLIREIRKCLVN